MSRIKWTNEKIDQFLINFNKKIKRKGNYTNNKDKNLEWKCLVCNYGANGEWKVSWVSIKNNGCPKCYGNLTLTNDTIDKALVELNKKIKRKSNYTNARDNNLKWECLVCGYGSDPEELWRTSWDCIKNSNCRDCAGKVPLTNKRIDRKLKEQGREHLLIRLEDVRGGLENIWWSCLVCEYFWKNAPSEVVSSRRAGCPDCAGKAHLTKERFIEKALLVPEHIGKNYNYSLINEITNNSTKVIIICKKHGKFKQSPNSHLSGRGCSLCKNKQEHIIFQLLKDNNIEFKYQYQIMLPINKKNNKSKIDFYIPLLNLFIEYNGEQHYRPVRFGGRPIEKAEKSFKIQQKRDKQLRKYCKDNNINLLEINCRKYQGKKLENFFYNYFFNFIYYSVIYKNE